MNYTIVMFGFPNVNPFGITVAHWRSTRNAHWVQSSTIGGIHEAFMGIIL